MRHPVLRMVILALLVIAILLAALLGHTGEDEYGLPGRVPGRPATTAPATAPGTNGAGTGDAGEGLGRHGDPRPPVAGPRREHV